ncbi:MAG: hypothetical protein Q9169_007180 [Polycauliona sp. 2 TL-2023]
MARVNEKKEQCEKKQWVLYVNKNGEKIMIRGVLTRLVERFLKSTVQTSRHIVDEPILRIEKYEDDVFKLVSLVQNECLSSSIADAIACIKQNIMNPHVSIEERRRQLSATLNAVDSKNTYETALQSRHDNTCEWALQLDELRAWVSPPIEGGKLFWIHGPPGFGKTFMSAWIIHHLTERLQEPVAYFFCVADNELTRDPYSILRSWLSQLLAQDDQAAYLMDTYIKKRTSKDQVLTHRELWQLWCIIVEGIPGCTFVVDGFDECTQINSGTQYHTKDPRSDFLRDLTVHLSGKKARVLVISRDISDIRAYLCKFPAEPCRIERYEYQITPHDTAPDVKLFSERMVKYKLPRKAEKLRLKIATEAAEKSDGMFLWIKLLENEISPEQNAKELSQTVLETPSGISEAYTREVEKIVQLSPKHKEKALKMLRWVLFAVRPLMVKELAEALIVSGDDDDSHEYPHDYLPDSWNDGFVEEDYVNGMILGRCGSLIELRSTCRNDPLANRTVHFVHFSVKEYLSSIDPADPLAKSLGLLDDEMEQICIAKICLRYLTLDVFRQIPPDTRMYPFLSYAAWAWYFHGYRKIPLDSQDIVQWTQKVFDPSQSNWRVWTPFLEAQLLSLDDPDGRSVSTDTSPGSESSDTSSDGGIEEIDPPLELCPGGQYGSAIVAAAASSTVEMAVMLLDKGIFDSTTISLACDYGNSDVVSALMGKGPDLGLADKRGAIPLHLLITDEKESLACTLLDAGAPLYLESAQGLTPLVLAIAYGCSLVIKRLLQLDADVNHCCREKWTALHHMGCIDTVRDLLEAGADVTMTDDYGSTPLHSATIVRHQEVMELLIEHGASLDFRVASLAADMGNLAALELLLKREILFTGIDESSQATLFDTAMENNHNDIARFLLVNACFQSGEASIGLSKLQRRSTGKVAEKLSMMVFSHDVDATTELLHDGTGTDPAQADLDETLRIAAACGFADIATLLLTKGARTRSKDVNGRTALHHALSNKHEDVASLLVEHGANLSQEDDIGSTPVDLAVKHGQRLLNFIKLYLRDLTLSIKRRPSPLEYSAQKGQPTSSLNVRNVISGTWNGYYEYLA